MYITPVCLNESTRYRFQLRNTSGGAILGQYKLTYRGQVIFNTEWSSNNNLGRVSTFRFKTNENGKYVALGSNSFTPHAQLSESAEIGAEGLAGEHVMAMTGLIHEENSHGSSEHMRSPQGYDYHEEGEGEESVGSLEYLLTMDYNLEDNGDGSNNGNNASAIEMAKLINDDSNSELSEHTHSGEDHHSTEHIMVLDDDDGEDDELILDDE
eukprot:CAMPEP_0172322498 /NCGR_PEP_ID=MMETSP1058-20130122/46071_1 /TAXON_ID=83371 /ORGANISM="Detonula confervacea, Strain CCMP 353" /LENGTH=210 /DNA_ID=CAMNT_0013038257 /DNA_START=327 /DNA_END=956 /DNA_ORIENTATION=-